MDDPRSEVRKLKYYFAGFVLFCISLYFSFGEMKYALSGDTTDAVMVSSQIKTKRTRRGGTRETLVVTYRFDDNGTSRQETDDVKVDWTVPAPGGPIAIEYIPGSSGSSRLAGHSQEFFVYIFLACLAYMGYACFKFWRFYKS